MLAKLTDRLPAGPGWLFEPKLDGLRCIATVGDTGSVSLTSRHGAGLTRAFPEIAAAVADTVPSGAMIDGEIVHWSAGGRLDFEALQRRLLHLAPVPIEVHSERCHFVVFDVLRSPQDGDVTDWPLSQRRQLLQQWIPPGRPSELMLVLQTADVNVATIWTRALAGLGIDGIIAKHAGSTYQPGVRGWCKVQRYASTEVIIGGVTGSLSEPLHLIVGRRHPDGRLHVTGRTAELSTPAARQIAAVVKPPSGHHPWPAELPLALHEYEPSSYHQVDPTSVVEIRFDTARRSRARDSWPGQLRFRRLRPDLTPAEIPEGLRLEA
ncbi:ATP-dependent DNA ligase [Microlunatus parietis]|uniref:ATP-dependent DNA ligase n=2 Tax=Microlunatus parietis TaxID=682979 RepID=A0A7Y9LA75_9ACTN|nr:ATP-dependent DNA ligase [Microlunatus parietis]